jgi:signal transduction histidine kinase
MAHGARARALVVDDHDANRLLVVETLQPEGIEVVEAASGEEALARFAERPTDVVLLDVRMGGMDGFQTLEQLRALPGGDRVPVVFFTALRDVDTFDRARRVGALDFLTKPVRPSELLVRIEASLRMRDLGAEVAAHVAALRTQRDDLVRLSLQKERLAAFLVHDLKNPLSAMRLHATVLERTPGLSESARESAVAIREQSDRLQQMILNLLDLSKADEGQLAPRLAPIEVGALFDDVLHTARAHAGQRQVSVEHGLTERIRIHGDRDLLRRVLENLVDNALRHTPRAGRVRLEADETVSHVELRVADSGPGIPHELRTRIFDPFVQLDGGTAATRTGRGLGLAFCRTAVIAHGGAIEVDASRPGACFVVRLPRGAGT